PFKKPKTQLQTFSFTFIDNMTKTPQSSRKSQGAEKRRSSVAQLKTPRRSTKRQREEDYDDNGCSNTWDFDAPKFYDFGVSKTPGMTTDKWFGK
ncbi:hypothetical protein LPJ81_006925, partial [Coemansia sp. IMI 209127]